MNSAVPEVFDRTVHESYAWLREISEQIGPDRQRAYHALRATLHTLRDRLTPNEAADLAAQMPTLVRGIFYEGWRPADTPVKLRSKEEFVGAVAHNLQGFAPMDPEQAARAVFNLLKTHVSQGEIEDVKGQLPEDIRAMWN